MTEDTLSAVLLAILGPGGLLVVWLTMNRDRQSKDQGADPTIVEAREAEAEREGHETGVLAQWRTYADEADERIRQLERRQQGTEDRMEAQQKKMRQLVRRDLLWAAHNAANEMHILKELGPPPPELPEELKEQIIDVLAQRSSPDPPGD